MARTFRNSGFAHCCRKTWAPEVDDYVDRSIPDCMVWHNYKPPHWFRKYHTRRLETDIIRALRTNPEDAFAGINPRNSAEWDWI